MNREIKFRVWDKLEKRFDKNSHLIMDMNGNVENLQNGAGGKDYVLQQFTGLKDKNGREIYEGDIILEYYHNEGYYSNGQRYRESGHRKLEVIWNPEGAFWAKYIDWFYDNSGSDNGKPVRGWITGDSLRIIGNIFENPDLLK